MTHEPSLRSEPTAATNSALSDASMMPLIRACAYALDQQEMRQPGVLSGRDADERAADLVRAGVRTHNSAVWRDNIERASPGLMSAHLEDAVDVQPVVELLEVLADPKINTLPNVRLAAATMLSRADTQQLFWERNAPRPRRQTEVELSVADSFHLG